MSNKKELLSALINKAYTFEGSAFDLGAATFEGEVLTGSIVRAPLEMMNRHGLIAGATGTGKTKSLQVVAESLSNAGVPSLLMDIKGDLSGLAMPSPGHSKIDERHRLIGLPFTAEGYTIEPLTISDEKGVRLRATVTEFGPVLFSKVLELNDTQSGVLAVLFKYCDDHEIPLLDLADMKQLLIWAETDGKESIQVEYGLISTSSLGAIKRKVVELESQGAERFFGEESFDPADLLRVDEKARGIISILRLTDIRDRPKLFSTFMLSLLAEIYATFPEAGDLDKPKLAVFIDEAHLVFDNASKALMDQLESIIKLIRSKGVGIFFCTQNPSDIPEAVLSQLGFRIQHSLRAFTAKDRKRLKLIAQNFPPSAYYNIEERLTSLGIGEALVSVLNEDGIPTPLVSTLLRAPKSRMDILNAEELDAIVSDSELVREYNQDIDRESAFEILSEKLEIAKKEPEVREIRETRRRGSSKKEKTLVEKLSGNTMVRQIGRTVARELTRGLLGALGVKTNRRRRSNSIW